jgi:hypothetical protein
MQFTSVLLLFLFGFMSLANSMPTNGDHYISKRTETPQQKMVALVNELKNQDFGETETVTTTQKKIISFHNADGSQTKLMAKSVSGSASYTVHNPLITFLTNFANEGNYGSTTYQGKVEFEV